MTPDASTSENRAIDIPIILRGKIIEPGDDAIEFGGRAGARFRSPDPRKHAADLLLKDASALRDLHDTPIDEIIDFLAELGPRLTLENPLMHTAFRLALAARAIADPPPRPLPHPL